MSTKPKASEAAANIEAKTGTASEAQSGTMSPATGTAGETADAAWINTLPADAGGRPVYTSRPGSPLTDARFKALRDAGGILNFVDDEGDSAELIGEKGGSIDPDGRYTVVVQGPVAGRWRIGRKFTAEPTSIPASELTEAQVTALRYDAALMVSVIAAPY